MRNIFATVLLIAAALAVSGCGGNTATVSGKVTYQGRAVTSGTVTVISPDGKVADSAPIQKDGTFTLKKAPTGNVKVGVDNPPPPGLWQEAPKGMSPNDPEIKASRELAQNFVAIPTKYRDPNQSGLTAAIKGGKNTLPLDLQ